jgi:hypothetical protein
MIYYLHYTRLYSLSIILAGILLVRVTAGADSESLTLSAAALAVLKQLS